MTSISLSSSAATSVKADAVVIGVHGTDTVDSVAAGGEKVASAYGKSFLQTLTDLEVSPETGRITKIPGTGATKAAVVVVVGLGDKDELELESLRRASGAAARALAGKATVALALPATSDDEVRAVADGALLGAYAYDHYLEKKTEPVGEFVILTDLARSKTAKQTVSDAETVTAAVHFARDLVNAPPNDLYPESFADRVTSRARRSKVSVSVSDEKTLESKGYGGILGVGQGSARPPRLVKLSYKPSRPVAHIAFVGKGITFDSGGLSIKPSNAMVTMKCDMAGAAAVSAAVFAIADLGLPVRVTAYACLAENMPSGKATRPGDVLTMYGGKTVEVLNTDAEGRLVLGDALALASKTSPDVLVDVATLTGACQIALGDRVSGILGNDDALVELVRAAGGRVGEALWQLPISEEMPVKVRTYSRVADLMQHNVDLYGG
ncbi:MAG: leucyl aminopeptidase, partial [Nocardioidaceae bacterium]|nr:leucyl aminopeptidase [Nocardioidaceae bacterium]